MTELITGTYESDTHQKSLRINLDPRWYGTIAEIGAGQEVSRWFFRVGGAAGTIASSISAKLTYINHYTRFENHTPDTGAFEDTGV